MTAEIFQLHEGVDGPLRIKVLHRPFQGVHGFYQRFAVTGVNRAPARSVRGNVLSTTEFVLVLVVKYTLVGRDGKPLSAGGASGSTSFFVGSDVNTDERQALPLAAEGLARNVVSQLSEGW